VRCSGRRGTAVPFVSSFQPSEKAKAAGAAVEVDISALKPGEKITVEWRGKPVWIMKRTPEQLAALPRRWTPAGRSEVRAQGLRVDAGLRPQRSPLHQARVLVASASAPTWAARLPTSSSRAAALAARRLAGRLLCPCHGSTFDLAGRVFKNKPAPDNLEVPPHMYLSESKLLIGEDKKA
jgi:ubiquinol-cytochrome c reductase iron-sulfur subunit